MALVGAVLEGVVLSSTRLVDLIHAVFAWAKGPNPAKIVIQIARWAGRIRNFGGEIFMIQV